MFQKFNDDNMLTKFIKNLLHTTYVPTVQIWKPGRPIIKDFVYITKDYIVKALKNWPNDRDNIGPMSNLDERYFKVVEPYVRNQFYKGITSNYDSTTSNYDAETHYYLGQYLRMIRDLDDINLMPFYNCWDGIYSDSLRVFKEETVGNDGTKGWVIRISQRNKKVDGYKTLLVPIKFNTKYTIYANSNLPITMFPIYYDGIGVIPSNKLSDVDFYKEVSRCATNCPYLYEGIYTNKNSLDTSMDNLTTLFEDYLTLLIQVPESYSSGIVVLEGDYTNTSLINILQTDVISDGSSNRLVYSKKWVNKLPTTIISTENGIDAISDDDFERCFKFIPSITKTITRDNYAFSDRLIEYLLMNVITKNDEVSDNIKRIQQYNSSTKSYSINKKSFAVNASQRGVWDRYLRLYNYDIAVNAKCPLCYDVNGYVDKDTESIILRGKE